VCNIWDSGGAATNHQVLVVRSGTMGGCAWHGSSSVIIQQVLDHVRSVQEVSHSSIVVPRADAWIVVSIGIAVNELLNTPDITAIRPDPCSSLAIRLASSMSNVPMPCDAIPSARRPFEKRRKLTWCWNFFGSLEWTGAAVPYTCNSLTRLQPPSIPTSSLRYVPSSEHFRNRSRPTRMSASGSS